MDISALLTGRNAMLPVGVFMLTTTLKQLFKGFFAGAIGQRVTPLIPLVFGVTLAMLGAGEGAERWQDKLLVGLLASFTAGHLFKVGRTSFLGWGVDAAPDAADAGDPPPPAPPAPPAANNQGG